MPETQRGNSPAGRPNARWRILRWLSGLWVLPVYWLLGWVLPPSPLANGLLLAATALLAPVPALLVSVRQRSRALSDAQNAREQAEQLKLQLETVRYRTARLREELSAADQQARLSHQLTLLGQFTAGFMHEFNNPLAIVTSRIEVLLEERAEDAELCRDLQQMLKETRYMGNIARTLLQALRRERGGEVFEPSAPVRSAGRSAGGAAPVSSGAGSSRGPGTGRGATRQPAGPCGE